MEFGQDGCNSCTDNKIVRQYAWKFENQGVDLDIKGTRSLYEVYSNCNAAFQELANFGKATQSIKWKPTRKEEMIYRYEIADVLTKAPPKIKFSTPRKNSGDRSKLVKEC